MFVSQVALCAGCNAVHPYAAFVIGIIAGMAYVAWSTLMLRLRVDDPLDAVAGKWHQNSNIAAGTPRLLSQPYTQSRPYCFSGCHKR